MKMKLSPLLVGLSLAILVPQAQANELLEIDEVNGTLVGTLDGNPITLTLTGPQNGWTISLPLGLIFNGLQTVELGEPENSSQKNEVLVGTSPGFLTWTSDIPNNTGNSSLPASVTITLAGIDVLLFPRPFDLKLVDKDDGAQKGVPDTCSTAGILVLAVFGILAVSRVCGVKAQF
jgi:hypothetical protein